MADVVNSLAEQIEALDERQSLWVLKNPANHDKAVPITEEEFHYAFTNNLTAEQSKPIYDQYAIPVSGRMLFEAGFANFRSTVRDSV
ncbi:hypothetical protein AB0O52_04725 [Arthrobacter sp. NPDC080073]|uniref:hypothetical protein n=1 Tax=Arthrobacter sp. NPDC080073 TaxID=3155919 RepID=UPI0034280B97